jgi:HSP20 family protein
MTRRSGGHDDPGHASWLPRHLFSFIESSPLSGARLGRAGWCPAVDVWETREAIVVVSEVAGIDEASLDVRFEGAELVLRGTRPEPVGAGDARIRQHQMELSYGRFERVVAIPAAVDGQRIEATYRHGMLTIRCPKLEPNTKIRVVVSTPDAE